LIVPSFVSVELNLIRRTTPISQLEQAFMPLKSQGDIVMRKDSVMLVPPDGQITALESGKIFLQFRSRELKHVLEWTERTTKGLFEVCGFPSDEPLDLDIEVVLTVPTSSNPRQYLDFLEVRQKFAKLSETVRNCGSENSEYALGVTFFLTPFNDKTREIRLRVEPAISEPEKKFFVALMYTHKKTTLSGDFGLPGLFKEVGCISDDVTKFLQG
jgi:hypothetical protein